MSAIINARSPYYVKYVSPNNTQTLDSILVNVFIYDGVKTTDKPTTSDFQISRSIISSTIDYIVIDVSEFIRDELITKYYTSAIDAVWVELDAIVYLKNADGSIAQDNDERDFLAFDGFGYFQEGANPRTSNDPTQSSYTPQLLQDNQCIYFDVGRDIRIPLFSEPQPTISYIGGAGYWNTTDYYWTAANINWSGTTVILNVTDSNDSDDKIQYLILDSSNLGDGDTITIQSTTGNSQTNTLTLKALECGKYEKIRAIFYNKYGALQDIWLDKKSVKTLSTKDESFKANTLDYSTTIPSYDTNTHTKQRFDVLGNERITANTGFVGECMNEPVKQMLLSESIWLEFEDLTVIPVIIKTSSQQEKTHINDKLIQHTFEFEYAFDTIQNVR